MNKKIFVERLCYSNATKLSPPTLNEEIFAGRNFAYFVDGLSICKNKFPQNKKNSLIRKNTFLRKIFFL